MSSFDQLLDEGANNKSDKADETQTNTQTKTTPAPSEPTNGKTIADKTQHELVQKYRLEKKQQMVAEGTAPDDEFAIDAGVERRREERRAEERRRLAAVAEHRRRLKYNASTMPRNCGRPRRKVRGMQRRWAMVRRRRLLQA